MINDIDYINLSEIFNKYDFNVIFVFNLNNIN